MLFSQSLSENGEGVMVDFNGRVVLITGAGRGLGFAYARCMGQLGAMVLIQDIGANSHGGGVSIPILRNWRQRHFDWKG